MVRIIAVDDLLSLIRKVTLDKFFKLLIERLRKDYARWDEFKKTPRHATHFDHGVFEVMPIADQDYYSYKYVNGHPNNPHNNKQTVVAMGMLAEIPYGYPVMISEMTLLTALRTAATSALVSQYMARKNSKTFGIIGTGAQAEFQVMAHRAIFDIETIYYFDIDDKAMEKFSKNLKALGLKLIACHSAKEVVENADIITTATATKARVNILENAWIKPGMHINGIGGDCPGKTELDPAIIKRSKIVVELGEQSVHEGEIQDVGLSHVYAELWELASGMKRGREHDDEVTLFDSVGFALEDYSVLRLVYSLAEDYHVGHCLDMVPDLTDPKDLFGILKY